MLWVAIIFTALLGLGRAFVPEREQRVLDALVLAPCDRSAIWLAKALATLAFLVARRARRAARVRALLPRAQRGATILAIVLADLGICAVGTFLGAMAVATRARDLLLPLLFLPLAIPIVIGGVGRLRRRLAGPVSRLSRPLRPHVRARLLGLVRVRRDRVTLRQGTIAELWDGCNAFRCPRLLRRRSSS